MELVRPPVKVQQAQQKKPKRSKKRLWIVVFIVIILSGLSVGGFFYSKRERNPFPENILKQVNFPLYYPIDLPDGVNVDKESIEVTDNVLLFNIKVMDNKDVVVSIQPMTSDIDFERYSGTKSFTSNIGRAILLDLPERTTAAILTEKSWILINAPVPIAADLMEQIANSFRLVN